MATDLDLRPHLIEQAKHFTAAHDAFHITVDPGNGYPERTVSRYMIQALVAAIPGSQCLLEVPISHPERKRQDEHIDALIFNDDLCVIAEFKRVYARHHWDWLGEDAIRLKLRVAPILHERFKDGRHRQVIKFVGADCWYADHARIWKGERTDEVKTKPGLLPPIIAGLHRDALTLRGHQAAGMDGYYWLWAWGLCDSASPTI